MAWNDAPPTADELKGAKWDAAPPTPEELGNPIKEDVPYAASAAAGAVRDIPFAKTLGAIGKTGADVLSGTTPFSQAYSQYQRERGGLEKDVGAIAEANPKTAMLGGLIGSTALPIPGGARGGALYGGASALSNSKADLSKGEVDKAIGDTLWGSTLGAVIGDASEALPGVSKKVGSYLRDKANAFKLKSTGLTGKAISKLDPDTAEYMFKNKIGGMFSGPGDIAEKASASIEQSGQRIGDVLENKLSGATVDRNDIIATIDSEISKLSNNEGEDELVNKLTNIRNGIAAKADKNPVIPIGEAENIKRSFQSKVNWNSPDPDKISNNANTSVSDTYRQAVEDSATKANPEVAADFKADKENYRILSPVAKGSKARADQLNQSPHGGLLDTSAAATGALLGHAPGAVLAPIARRALSPRLASFEAHTARGASWLADLVSKYPEKLGPYAGALEQAAARGTVSLMMKDKMLREKDPEYAATVDKALEPDEIPESSGPMTVLIKTPSGKVKSIPIELKEQALAAGGTLVK